MVSNRVLWPRRGQTHTEAVRVSEEAPLTPHVLHIFRICGLDEPGTEEVGVLRGLAHETTAKMAIVPEATCGHIGQASDADPEGAASTICHEVADSRVIHGEVGDYGSEGQITGHCDLVSLILIEKSQKYPKRPRRAP
jgi:hypothetical protein